MERSIMDRKESKANIHTHNTYSTVEPLYYRPPSALKCSFIPYFYVAGTDFVHLVGTIHS